MTATQTAEILPKNDFSEEKIISIIMDLLTMLVNGAAIASVAQVSQVGPQESIHDLTA